MQLERYIDHTLLKPTATPKAIRQLCAEAREFNFYAVCVNSCYVALAKEELKDSGDQNSRGNWFSIRGHVYRSQSMRGSILH